MANTRGPRGAQGKVGHVRPEGPLLTRSARAALLDAVEGQIEEIRHDLTIHKKRIGLLQEQVEEVRLAIRELTASDRTTPSGILKVPLF